MQCWMWAETSPARWGKVAFPGKTGSTAWGDTDPMLANAQGAGGQQRGGEDMQEEAPRSGGCSVPEPGIDGAEKA